jgi:imidazolonepropionase-like amidohydrolase
MATLGSAEILGRDDLGELAPGKYADIVALRGDPLADISAIRDIAHVWSEGVRT